MKAKKIITITVTMLAAGMAAFSGIMKLTGKHFCLADTEVKKTQRIDLTGILSDGRRIKLSFIT